MSARSRLALATIAFLLLIPWVLPDFYTGIYAFAGVSAIVAVGLTLLLQAGQISLGQGAFMGMGAYGSALVARAFGVDAAVTLILSVCATSLIAAFIGFVTLRLRGHYLPLATLAYGLAFVSAFIAWHGVTGGASGLDKIPPLGLFGFELRDDRIYAQLIWLVVILSVIGLSRLRTSRAGRAIATLESHDGMARSFGIDTTVLRVQVFVLSAALAALAGGLYVHMLRFVSPSPFGLMTSFKVLIMAVVGGPAGAAGGVLGALTLESAQWALQDLLTRWGAAGNLEVIVFGLLLVIMLLKWPSGLWPAVEKLLPARKGRQRGSEVLPKPTQRVPSDTPLLALEGIGIRFGGLQALSDVSLTLKAGEFVGLIGPNGAGKSTLFSIISGLLQPSTGSVSLFGGPLRRSHTIVRRGMARTFQHVQLVPDLTVIENVAIGAHWRTRSGVIKGLLGLDEVENQRVLASAYETLVRVGLAAEANLKTSDLPLGKQRIVEIARALLAEPQILLLDEPAAGLRFSEKLSLVRLLRRLQAEGVTILLVEHDMELVMGCVERLIVLDRGKIIAEGTPQQVQASPEVIAAYLGGAHGAAA